MADDLAMSNWLKGRRGERGGEGNKNPGVFLGPISFCINSGVRRVLPMTGGIVAMYQYTAGFYLHSCNQVLCTMELYCFQESLSQLRWSGVYRTLRSKSLFPSVFFSFDSKTEPRGTLQWCRCIFYSVLHLT